MSHINWLEFRVAELETSLARVTTERDALAKQRKDLAD